MKLIFSYILLAIVILGSFWYFENNKSPNYIQRMKLSSYIKEANSVSDKKLVLELVEGLKKLNNESYETNLALRMSAYLREYENRNLITDENEEIEKLRILVLSKYSPCWGIPEGDCWE